MDAETRRQAVHISGILFIFLAQFIGNIICLYFFAITITLLLWSIHIQRVAHHSKSIIEKIEKRFREFALTFERRKIAIPFAGAIWYFFSCGLVFFIFPLDIASAACIILSVGDAVSNLVGRTIGKIKTIGEKTVEGSLGFFL